MIKINEYPKYKDSGIEWIGKIPEHWKTTLIQECYEYRNEKVSDNYYPPLSVTKKGVVPQLENAAKTDAHDNRKKVLKGDFAINSRSDRKGSCGVSKYDGSVSLIYHVLKPRNKQIENFSHSLFKDVMFSEEFYKWGHGIVDDLWTTQYPEMKKITIPLPPMDEIDIISNKLKKITHNLNNQITKNKKLITLLKEKRTSLINQTVTKGLNTDARMKESGIKWIGKIPEHWFIIKIKYCTNLENNKITSNQFENYIGLEHIESKTGKIIDNNVEEVDSSVNYFSKNNILFGKLRPYLTKVARPSFDGVCSSEILVYNVNNNLSKNYLYYLMLSNSFIDYVNSLTYGVKMPRANSNQINNINIPLPKIKEQEQIADYLDNKTQQIDKTIEKIEKNIELLEEYKESLIHHVVTGKIDVRGVEV